MQIHSFYCNCIPCEISGIQDINITDNITLYPNPATHTVFLETESNIKVCNMQGVVLQELYDNRIDLSAYPQCIYLLQVNGAWTKVVKK